MQKQKNPCGQANQPSSCQWSVLICTWSALWSLSICTHCSNKMVFKLTAWNKWVSDTADMHSITKHRIEPWGTDHTVPPSAPTTLSSPCIMQHYWFMIVLYIWEVIEPKFAHSDCTAALAEQDSLSVERGCASAGAVLHRWTDIFTRCFQQGETPRLSPSWSGWVIPNLTSTPCTVLELNAPLGSLCSR